MTLMNPPTAAPLRRPPPGGGLGPPRDRMTTAVLLLLLADAPLAPEPADAFEATVRPLLEEHCYECHDPDDGDNHVGFLSAVAAADIQSDRRLWASVAEQLRNRTMPPATSTQPSEDDRMRLADWIDGHLEATACLGGERAPAVQARRLNRTEYDASVRLLFGLDLNPAEKFPGDGGGGEGFDNNGETLYLPPILMEKYLAAAREVLDRAIVSPKVEVNVRADALAPPGPTVDVRRPDGQTRACRTLEEGGELSAVFVAPREETLTVRAVARPAEGESPDASLRLSLDGVAVGDFETAGLTPDGQGRLLMPVAVRVGRGQHVLTLASVRGAALVEILQVWSPTPKLSDARKQAHRRTLQVEVGTRPKDRDAGARRAVADLMRRAFRGPVEPGEVARMMTLYRRGRERGDSWEESVKLAMTGVLCSPRFLFRLEPAAAGGRIPLDDFALASRLSYFLTASAPDDALRTAAEAGRLSDPAEIASQVARLAASPESMLFAERFVGQWLGTHEVGRRFSPDTGRFKGEFNQDLLRDLRREPTRFFRFMLEHDRPLTDLIDSDYTLLNSRLAKHYGYMGEGEGKVWPTEEVPGRGERPFTYVALPDRTRGGVLGMGAAQMICSYPRRTSPVLRGAWVLEAMLGAKIPPPPADVPELVTKRKGKPVGVRESLARHREDPSCAACHNLMDPIGFALEGFDVLGRHRRRMDGRPIDLTATLPGGREIDGPAELREALLDRKDEFVRHLTGRMLGYALGRSLVDSDDCTIQRVSRRVIEDGYSTRTLVREIALSVPFRYVDAQ